MLAKKEQLYLNAMLHKHKSEFGDENKKKQQVGTDSCPPESCPLKFLANKREIKKEEGKSGKTFKTGVRRFWNLFLGRMASRTEFFRGLRT